MTVVYTISDVSNDTYFWVECSLFSHPTCAFLAQWRGLLVHVSIRMLIWDLGWLPIWTLWKQRKNVLIFQQNLFPMTQYPELLCSSLTSVHFSITLFPLKESQGSFVISICSEEDAVWTGAGFYPSLDGCFYLWVIMEKAAITSHAEVCFHFSCIDI